MPLKNHDTLAGDLTMKQMLLLILGALLFSLGCSEDVHGADTAAPGQSELRNALDGKQPKSPGPTEEKGVLLLFLNPHRSPCLQQNDIVRRILPAIDDRVNLVYVRTDVSADRSVFSQYGIRSLPSMILMNPDGTIGERFSSGIHEAEAILEAVSRLKR